MLLKHALEIGLAVFFYFQWAEFYIYLFIFDFNIEK